MLITSSRKFNYMKKRAKKKMRSVIKRKANVFADWSRVRARAWDGDTMCLRFPFAHATHCLHRRHASVFVFIQPFIWIFSLSSRDFSCIYDLLVQTFIRMRERNANNERVVSVYLKARLKISAPCINSSQCLLLLLPTANSPTVNTHLCGCMQKNVPCC